MFKPSISFTFIDSEDHLYEVEPTVVIWEVLSTPIIFPFLSFKVDLAFGFFSTNFVAQASLRLASSKVIIALTLVTASGLFKIACTLGWVAP